MLQHRYQAFCISAGLLLSGAALHCNGQSLSGVFQSRSLVISYATGAQGLAVGFTTPSDTPSLNPQLPLNGEFKYLPSSPAPYQSYWIMYQQGSLLDLGVVGFGNSALLADSDANGIPNFAERALAANVTVPLLAISDIDGSSSTGTITLTRNAGQVNGNAVTRFNSGPVFSGTWTLPIMDASGSYDPAQRTVRLRTTSSFFAATTMTATYTIDSPDTVTLANILFQLDTGTRVTSTPVTLTRTGKTYLAIVEFVDGNPVSNNFPDFRKWTLQLTDPADNDGDGIPNLSDATPNGPPPVLLSSPANAVRNVGQSVTFTANASGTSPLFYQWTFNGTPITGAMAASFTIPAVKLTDAGTYSLIVSNAGGTVASTPASLTVNDPSPDIPQLSFKRDSLGRITLSWTGAAKLNRATVPSGPFSPVTGASSGYLVSTQTAEAYFRLTQ